MKKRVKAAVAQFVPVHMNKKETLNKLANIILEAGQNGAEIIATGEVSIPTYPYWRSRFTYSDKDPEILKAWREVTVRYYEESVKIPDDLAPLCEAARKGRIYCVIGVSEQDDIPGSNTLYNTQVIIGPDGAIIGKHRKLVPTHEERLVWGQDDGSTLKVWPTEIGTIGALVCYENHMLLPKAALAFMGEEIHCACWPGWLGHATEEGLSHNVELVTSDMDSAIREYAFSTQNFVLSASNYVPESSIPDDFPFKKWGNWSWAIGGSAIVAPSGKYLAGPVFEKETIIYADLNRDDRVRAKVRIDSVGHYARTDVLSLRFHPHLGGGIDVNNQINGECRALLEHGQNNPLSISENGGEDERIGMNNKRGENDS